MLQHQHDAAHEAHEIVEAQRALEDEAQVSRARAATSRTTLQQYSDAASDSEGLVVQLTEAEAMRAAV